MAMPVNLFLYHWMTVVLVYSNCDQKHCSIVFEIDWYVNDPSLNCQFLNQLYHISLLAFTCCLYLHCATPLSSHLMSFDYYGYTHSNPKAILNHCLLSS